MLLDARNILPGATVTADVCIIGAGAAGITLAREFIGRPFRVCLLESGGLTADNRRQSLNDGATVGLVYFPLIRGRLRYFGGTTNHWDGWCRPLDAIDFEARDWVPHSGWPFGLETLLPYYERAQPICQLGPFNYDGKFWHESEKDLPFDPERLQTRIFQISPPTRFGEVYRNDIQQAGNIDTYLNANVLELVADDNASTVKDIRVSPDPGKEFTVRARWVILACGGIENARLLLVSDGVQKNGLGNGADLVGRFFMEHPSVSMGCLLPADAALPDYEFYKPHAVSRDAHLTTISGMLTLPAATIRRERLVNAMSSELRTVTPKELKGVASAEAIGNAFKEFHWPADFASHLREVIANWDEIAWVAGKRAFKQPVKLYDCELCIEQAPDPESRISLTRDKDYFQQRRVQLNWKVGDLEKRTLAETWKAIGQEVGRLGIGRVAATLDMKASPLPWRGVYHHMGTTRMHEDPKRGVVDPNGRVHGMSNLYIAGSSLFPTAGTANPTLTLVALALRLADHLKQEIK